MRTAGFFPRKRLFRFGNLQRIQVEGFELVYRQYRDVVLRFAMRCVGRREIAEEITADAFLRLHQNWTSIDTEMLPSWLLTVVKNRAADYWRRAQLEKRYVAEERPQERSQSAEPLWGLFEHRALRPVHRICLTLRYIHEMTVSEIGAYLGLTEFQVKGHLQYARGLLRKQLSPGQAND